jgi:hypothetical protein
MIQKGRFHGRSKGIMNMANIFLSYAHKGEASAQRLVDAFHDLGMVIISALFVSPLGAMVARRFY